MSMIVQSPPKVNVSQCFYCLCLPTYPHCLALKVLLRGGGSERNRATLDWRARASLTSRGVEHTAAFGGSARRIRSVAVSPLCCTNRRGQGVVEYRRPRSGRGYAAKCLLTGKAGACGRFKGVSDWPNPTSRITALIVRNDRQAPSGARSAARRGGCDSFGVWLGVSSSPRYNAGSSIPFYSCGVGRSGSKRCRAPSPCFCSRFYLQEPEEQAVRSPLFPRTSLAD